MFCWLPPLPGVTLFLAFCALPIANCGRMNGFRSWWSGSGASSRQWWQLWGMHSLFPMHRHSQLVCHSETWIGGESFALLDFNSRGSPWKYIKLHLFQGRDDVRLWTVANICHSDIDSGAQRDSCGSYTKTTLQFWCPCICYFSMKLCQCPAQHVCAPKAHPALICVGGAFWYHNYVKLSYWLSIFTNMSDAAAYRFHV